MTPDSEPLLCSCGKHSALLQPPGPKKPKWQVFSVGKSGHKPQIVTSRAKKVDALSVVKELCAGTYEKKNQPRAAPAAPAASRRKRRLEGDEKDAATTPAARRPAGPGRGHKGPRWDDSVRLAERVLKQDKPSHDELRCALRRATDECKLLRLQCEEVSHDSSSQG